MWVRIPRRKIRVLLPKEERMVVGQGECKSYPLQLNRYLLGGLRAPQAALVLKNPIMDAGAFLTAQLVKNLFAMQETWVRFLGREDPLEKEMAIHSSILAWRITWTVAWGHKSQVRLSD